VHIDGYNLLPYLTGEVDTSPRPGFVYFSDDGDVLALRFDNWKVVFMEQRAQGTLRIWAEPFVALRVPKLFNLRTDPFERATPPPTPTTTGSSTTTTSRWRQRP
jgi:arylsulfatase